MQALQLPLRLLGSISVVAQVLQTNFQHTLHEPGAQTSRTAIALKSKIIEGCDIVCLEEDWLEKHEE